MSEIIAAAMLRQLIDRWIAEGKLVAGPRRVKSLNLSHSKTQLAAGIDADLIQYTWLTSAEQLTLDNFIHPANSIKEFFFPRHESLYTYRINGKQIEIMQIGRAHV
jgi:hypothetical protein